MIQLTQTAVNKIQKQLQKRGRGLGIKIGVKTTGCSGLAYILEYVDFESPNYTIFSAGNFNIYVDQKALPYLQGMTIDYVRNGLNEGFEFQNPNEKSRCGCGESFRI